MTSLLSFIQTGRLGDVDLRATRAEVESAFGPPNDWLAGHEIPKSPIWKYGNIELHFDADDRVFLIFCDDFKVPIGAPFSFDIGELGDRTEESIELWLQHNEIHFKKEPWPWYEGMTVLRVISDVELKVYADPDEDESLSANESNIARLCSISRIAR